MLLNFLLYTAVIVGLTHYATKRNALAKVSKIEEEQTWMTEQLDAAYNGIEKMRQRVRDYDGMAQTVRHYQILANSLAIRRGS